jgi:hypothetical protein
LAGFIFGEQPDFTQHPDMGSRTQQVVLEQAAIRSIGRESH